MAYNYSRGTKKRVVATRTGHGSGAQSGATSEGEEIGGTGVRYMTTLNERMNKSLNRNAGPERPSANKGAIPVIGQMYRKTGKVASSG